MSVGCVYIWEQKPVKCVLFGCLARMLQNAQSKSCPGDVCFLMRHLTRMSKAELAYRHNGRYHYVDISSILRSVMFPKNETKTRTAIRKGHEFGQVFVREASKALSSANQFRTIVLANRKLLNQKLGLEKQNHDFVLEFWFPLWHGFGKRVPHLGKVWVESPEPISPHSIPEGAAPHTWVKCTLKAEYLAKQATPWWKKFGLEVHLPYDIFEAVHNNTKFASLWEPSNIFRNYKMRSWTGRWGEKLEH